MAGNYPDVPAPRMAYDRDGTAVGVLDSNNVITLLGSGPITNGNDDSNSTYIRQSGSFFQPNEGLFFIFPQLRDVVGYFLGTNRPTTAETSINTTNGFDGTWTSRGSLTTASGVNPFSRTAINSITWTGIKAIRLTYNAEVGFSTAHFYGAIAAGETPDRLRFWHPTLDEPLDDATSADGAFFDWGNIQRNTTSDKTFRIKNNSATLTANGIVISQQTLTDTTPTVNSQFTFSDGGAFAASINIGNLAPGAISAVVTKRFTRPSNAVLSLWTSRTIANPTSWT